VLVSELNVKTTLPKALATAFGVLALCAVLILAHVWRSEAQARKLLAALASLDVGKSTVANFQLIQERFRSYLEQTDNREFRFMVTNQPLAKWKIEPLAFLSGEVNIRDGKVAGVSIVLERQVGSYIRAAVISESEDQSPFCDQPYCVGSPIGKPFIVTHLDARVTHEQKRRIFDLNLSWITRFKGEPKISNCMGRLEESTPGPHG
jgi:hypothetical protein